MKALTVQTTATGGDSPTESVVANYARQVAEIAPSFRGRFGQSRPSLTVNASAIAMPGCFPSRGHGSSSAAGLQLRATVWEEVPKAPAMICAHVAVTNLNPTGPLLFQ